MSDKFGFFDPYFRSNGPFSFFGRDMSLDPRPDPAPETAVQTVADRLGDNSQPSDDDVNALARMIFGEGDQLYQVPGAMEGIGWAARNRVGGLGHPNSLQGVIKQPKQFQAVGTDTQPGTFFRSHATQQSPNLAGLVPVGPAVGPARGRYITFYKDAAAP